MEDITSLLDLDKRARADAARYTKKRFVYEKMLREEGKHFIGIVGARGVGKTILLKQLSLEVPNSIYISLDTFSGDLFNLIRTLRDDFKITTIFLDEVHFYKNFDEILKKCYDFLPLRIFFSSSVSLALYQSSFDLSRRVRMYTLFPFSFREFLYFKYGTTLASMSFADILHKKWQPDHLGVAASFDQYLMSGILPFSLDEPQPLPLLRNIATTVVRKDIPSIASLTTDELNDIENMLAFIGRSSVDNMNYSTLAHNLHITKYKAKQYLDYLEQAFIIHRVFPQGTNVLKEPKIFMAVPYRLLYTEFDRAIGALREDFFVEAVKFLGQECFYLKTNRGKKTPDFVMPQMTGNLVIEVGGKGKGHTQFKGMKAEEKIIFAHGLEANGLRRPLFLLGLVDLL
jgi:predicted AAA+ superfamily ATPase